MDKPVYLLKWMDAHGDEDWVTIDDNKDNIPYIVNTIGFLLYEDDKVVVMVASYGALEDGRDPQFSGRVVIPRCTILSREKIKND